MTNKIIDDGCPACKQGRRTWNFWSEFVVDLNDAKFRQYNLARTEYLKERSRKSSFKTEKNRQKYLQYWRIDINSI